MESGIIKPHVRILLSFYYFKRVDIGNWIATHFGGILPDIFADSGAFSAHNRNEDIDVAEYAEWIEQNRQYFVTYANLDVIGNPTATARNQRYLEQRGLHPLPVYHIGSPRSDLQPLIEQYDYIGIGGMVGVNRRRLASELTTLFSEYGGRAFHAFGTTSYKVISGFPWFSCDSTYWVAGARWASIPLYDPYRRKMHYVPLSDRRQLMTHDPVLRRYGFRATDFALPDNWTRRNRVGIGALSYMQIEQHCRQLQPVELPADCPTFTPNQSGGGDRAGLRVYLGNAKRDSDFRSLFDVWQKWESAHVIQSLQ